MIHPNMGTMLGFIMTDAAISKELLDKALKGSIEDTFNMVSVDGDTSTNDTVLVMANGMAGNPEITEENEDYEAFKEALLAVNTYLAKQIAGDGEGASRLFEVQVKHAKDKQTAKVLAKSIITSNLTKCAIFGKDANWGRILCAMGYSGAQFDPLKVDIVMASEKGEIALVENGVATAFDEEKAAEILSPDVVIAKVDVRDGDAEATAWGCDLTYDYVKINADYRS
jgi:glutamate N-acetyltransferase/amino-acid N-acetyltransferase